MHRGFPPKPEQLALHQRILRKAPGAEVDIYLAFMAPITAMLEKRGHRDDPHGFAIEAILFYLGHPERYDSAQSVLSTFLSGIALNKAIDHYRSALSERERHRALGEIVELDPPAPNHDLDREIDRQRLEDWGQHQEDPQEREFFRLWLQEASTGALADALGKGGCSQQEQRLAVKQCKDRLMKRLQRWVKRGDR